MRTVVVVGYLIFSGLSVFAQSVGFPFGTITSRDLELKSYDKDTSAVAVVLQEFGEAFVEDGQRYTIILRHHLKIKILKKGGLDYADFQIPLRKNSGHSESILSVKASTFNLENGSIREVKFDPKNQFTENRNKYYDIKKFALPNVRVGSVIEVVYELESPFFRNFRTWEFQDDIPKMMSEFWARIPANYRYNISLRGYLPLSKNESEVIRDCFSPGGGATADCLLMKCAMKDIPAFQDEDFMTARSNFLSSVNFELSEIDYFDGRKDKITKEWKDAEDELRREPQFGMQLKRGQDIVDQHVQLLIAGEHEPLGKAKKIYEFIQQWYRWNEVYGEYSEFGIKKAFDTKVGNVGDINLSLIAALRFAGLSVEPLLLSTRENGMVTELHPVLSDFNYVIAKLNISDKVYLLDATDDFLPFGLIPEHCITGKGRVLGEKESYWYDVKPPEKEKQVSIQKLTIREDGIMEGSIETTYFGYAAMDQRKKLFTYGDEAEYVKKLSNGWQGVTIKSHRIENGDDSSKPFISKLVFEMEPDPVLGEGSILFNPFFFDRWEKNPFRSSERFFPVDFGVPIDEIVLVTIEYPSSYHAEELPERVGLTLPNNGGRYIFSLQNNGSMLSLHSSLQINKTVFTSEEYHYLKELFSRIVSTQGTDLVFKKN